MFFILKMVVKKNIFLDFPTPPPHLSFCNTFPFCSEHYSAMNVLTGCKNFLLELSKLQRKSLE